MDFPVDALSFTNENEPENEMKNTPIEDIHELEPKESVTMTTGKLIRLYDAKTGTNVKGNWSIQKGTLADPSGEIEIMFKDRPTLPVSEWKGSEIVIKSHRSDKGWSGVYAEDDTFKGQTKRIIKVTPTGIVEKLNGSTGPTHEPPVSDEHRAAWPDAPESKIPPQSHHVGRHEPPAEYGGHPAPEPPPSAPRAAKAPAVDRDAEIDPGARRSILQIINLHLVCAVGVVNYEAPLFKKVTGRDMTESEIQGAIAQANIQATRAGLHNAMPQRGLTPDDF